MFDIFYSPVGTRLYSAPFTTRYNRAVAFVLFFPLCIPFSTFHKRRNVFRLFLRLRHATLCRFIRAFPLRTFPLFRPARRTFPFPLGTFPLFRPAWRTFHFIAFHLALFCFHHFINSPFISYLSSSIQQMPSVLQSRCRRRFPFQHLCNFYDTLFLV